MSQKTELFLTTGVTTSSTATLSYSPSAVAAYKEVDGEIGGCCPTTASQLGWSREDWTRYSPSTSPVAAGFIQLYNCSLIDKIVERFDGWGCR
jgi:hypothetical protein